MMLQSMLPAPKNSYVPTVETIENEPQTDVPVVISQPKQSRIPDYPRRRGFVPLAPEDYGDGGAYPELHIIQYPLNMGKSGVKSTAVIPVQVGAGGAIKTDLIVKQGTNRNKMVQSQIADLKEKEGSVDKLALPDEDEQAATAERTRAALEARLDGKIKSTKASTVVQSNEIAEPTYIRYTPNPNAPGYSENAKQRVIKMVEAQVDPMEPPKHKHQKIPRGPPSPPVPVLHSPPRKITVEDQQAWKIPPSISNWKNARGYIIPLDKRIQADGRGTEQVTINNKFATMSEALFIAERKATEDLKYRNDLRKQIAMKEKEEREANLREMANRARQERSGARQPEEVYENPNDYSGVKSGFDPYSNRGSDYNNERNKEFEEKNREFIRERKPSVGRSDDSDRDNNSDEEYRSGEEREEDKIARQQRERLRMERRKERERDLRLDNMKGNRKNKVDRDEGRDISEKIALGMMKGTGKLTGESMYDSRLFNQSSGMDSGFGGEDEYNTYTKPLFDRGEGNSVYRPKKDDGDIYGDVETQMKKLTDTSRFKPDKGFRGADSSSGGQARDAPVQFEKAGSSRRDRGDDRRREDREDREDDRRRSSRYDDDD